MDKLIIAIILLAMCTSVSAKKDVNEVVVEGAKLKYKGEIVGNMGSFMAVGNLADIASGQSIENLLMEGQSCPSPETEEEQFKVCHKSCMNSLSFLHHTVKINSFIEDNSLLRSHNAVVASVQNYISTKVHFGIETFAKVGKKLAVKGLKMVNGWGTATMVFGTLTDIKARQVCNEQCDKPT